MDGGAPFVRECRAGTAHLHINCVQFVTQVLDLEAEFFLSFAGERLSRGISDDGAGALRGEFGTIDLLDISTERGCIRLAAVTRGRLDRYLIGAGFQSSLVLSSSVSVYGKGDLDTDCLLLVHGQVQRMRIGPGRHKGSPFTAVSREGQCDRVNVVTDVLHTDIEVGTVSRFSLCNG